MRSLDIIRQKRRFIMFSEKTKSAVLELNAFFEKYAMHFEDKINKLFIYYDTPDFALLKSNIVLFKTVIGNFCELNMATEKISSTSKFTLRSTYKHFSKQIKAHDHLMKHKEFLIENFKNMFISGVNFDPEFLMQKLQPAYSIKTVSEEYRSTNGIGFKITYSFDKDIYTNHFTNISTVGNILTIYQHSNETTDQYLDDLISKLTRYCKELEPTSDTKIMICRAMTQKKQEQLNKLAQEREKLKRDKLLSKKKK